MKIEVISAWYNEELLAPLFLMHYDFADQITILLDDTSTDRTADILRSFPKAHIVSTHSPDGLDDGLKIGWINSAHQNSKSDWIIVADSDEFVFPVPYGADPRGLLELEMSQVVYAAMWEVFRHATDQDIDRTRPPVLQRRHGNPDLKHSGGMYRKPSVFRGGLNITLCGGAHWITSPTGLSSGKDWGGVHWKYADPCIMRSRDNGGRLSATNRAFQGQGQPRTEEQVLQISNQYQNCPEVVSNLCP